MSAEMEAAKKSAADVLAHCKNLVREPFATKDQREMAVQSAYELGVAEGRLAGVTEMGDSMITTLKGKTQ